MPIGIRDTNNIAPRGGFSWNVTGSNDFVIRGGSGLFYAVPNSQLPFQFQLFNGQRIIVNSFFPDGRPNFVSPDPLTGPQRGVPGEAFVTGKAPLTPQNLLGVISSKLQLPATNYQALVNTSTYGNPVQNSANTYLPRSGQFAFKITF